MSKDKDPTALVKAEYDNVCQLTDRQAKHLYLQICKATSSFNCEYFHVRLVSNVAMKKPWCLLGVGPNHLVIMDDKTKEITGTFAFGPNVKWQVETLSEKGYFALSAKVSQQLKVEVKELPDPLVMTAEDGATLEAAAKRMALSRQQQKEAALVSTPSVASRRPSERRSFKKTKSGSDSSPEQASGVRSSTHSTSSIDNVSPGAKTSTLPKMSTLPKSTKLLEDPGTGTYSRESSNGPTSLFSSPSSSPQTARRHMSVSINDIRQRVASMRASKSPSKDSIADVQPALPDDTCHCPEQPVRCLPAIPSSVTLSPLGLWSKRRIALGAHPL